MSVSSQIIVAPLSLCCCLLSTFFLMSVEANWFPALIMACCVVNSALPRIGRQFKVWKYSPLQWMSLLLVGWSIVSMCPEIISYLDVSYDKTQAI